MKFQIISVKIGKDAKKILESYKKLKGLDIKTEKNELFINVSTLEDFMTVIKLTNQNCFVCHDENVIHIYDQKLR